MHAVYVLYSPKLDRYYIGQSADVTIRLAQHNDQVNLNWTRSGAPWVLKAMVHYDSATTARKAEYWLKQQKSRKLLEDLIVERGKDMRPCSFAHSIRLLIRARYLGVVRVQVQAHKASTSWWKPFFI